MEHIARKKHMVLNIINYYMARATFGEIVVSDLLLCQPESCSLGLL